MSPRDRETARRRGLRKLDAMKRRTGQLRKRVIATAIVGFVLLWTAVFVQMATGNDPALGTGTVAKRNAAIEQKRQKLEASSPPPREEAERFEAEQLEVEQREAEARELEELEAITTAQS
jgi:hypothetical protein